MLLVCFQHQLKPIPPFGLGHYRSIALSPNFFFSTKSLPPGLLSPHNQHCSAGKVSQVCACCTSKKVIFLSGPKKVSTKCLLLFQGLETSREVNLQGSTRERRVEREPCVGSNKLPQWLKPGARAHPRSA